MYCESITIWKDLARKLCEFTELKVFYVRKIRLFERKKKIKKLAFFFFCFLYSFFFFLWKKKIGLSLSIDSRFFPIEYSNSFHIYRVHSIFSHSWKIYIYRKNILQFIFLNFVSRLFFNLDLCVSLLPIWYHMRANEVETNEKGKKK